MSYKQLFFIEGRLLGEVERGSIMRHATFMEPTSDLYFCGLCGEVYAKFPCLRPDGSSTQWQSYRCICRKCGATKQRWLSEWPGSIWHSWDKEFIAALPVPVLQWELERHIESWERIPNGYQ